MPTSSGSVLSSSGSGGRERERKPEGHQDASGGVLPQPVACHPTPTALLPLILPAESPHPAPRKQIIMGRPGTGKEELCTALWLLFTSDIKFAEPHCKVGREGMCLLKLMYSSLVLLAFIMSLGLQECHQSAMAMTHVHFTIVLQCKNVPIFTACFLCLGLPF